MKNNLTKIILGVLAVICLCGAADTDGCVQRDTRSKESEAQERVTQECFAAVGLPAIKNFREKRLLKDIYELRDQASLATFTYLVAENTGKLIFLGHSIGYGIPAATQYTAPAAASSSRMHQQDNVLPQADPNGLYSPASADGTWVMLADPKTHEVKPAYIEPRIIVSPFPPSRGGCAIMKNASGFLRVHYPAASPWWVCPSLGAGALWQASPTLRPRKRTYGATSSNTRTHS